MFKPRNEPLPQELDRLLTDEEREALSESGMPDDVRAELFERLERRRDAERDAAQAEDKSDADRPRI